MCDLKGCDREGRNVPQVHVRMKDRHTRKVWDFPATTTLRVCDECKPQLQKPEDVLADGGKTIVDALVALRLSAVMVSMRVGWTTIDSREYRMLQRSRPS